MNKPPHILIVEDEARIREVARSYLELDGYGVTEADTGSRALAALREQAFDLIILDIMLPGIDGLSIAESLRSETGSDTLNSRAPIIMLTSRSAENDRLTGFSLGVDDYVIKPFSPRELVARVKAVLRRSSPSPQEDDQPLVRGAMTIDAVRRYVTVGDQPVALTAKEFDLLYFLAQHPRQVFTRTQLLDKVWGYEFYGDESTVTVHIRRLREKVEPDPAHPTYVQTVWGVGYRFEAE